MDLASNTASVDTHPFSPLRREDDALLRGLGKFGCDIELPKAFHIAFVRSVEAHAKIISIDSASAKHAEGVHAVLVASDLGFHTMPDVNPLLPWLTQRNLEIMASETVSYVGQPIAIVVANNIRNARLAANKVAVSLESLAVMGDFNENAEITTHTEIHTGEIPTTDPSARVNFQIPRLSACPLEPRSCSAQWHSEGNKITVWVGTQSPSRAQADIAKVLGLPTTQVRLICPDVGGAFGARASVAPEDLLVALTAKHLQASAQWLSSRSEDFLAGMHGRGAQLHGQLWMSDKGKINALSAQMHYTLGAWLPYSSFVPLRNAARILPGPYTLRDIKIDGVATRSHTAPVTIYRGAGRPEATLLMESLVDIAARKYQLDPVKVRLQNLIPNKDMPYTTASGESLDSGNYALALEQACSHFNYVSAREDQNKRREKGELVGIGVAMYVEPCGQGWEAARVTMYADGNVTVASGSPSQGQGHETTFAKIAAGILQCEESKIKVVMGDSDLCPIGIGALASRSTAIAGSAIANACQLALKKKSAGDSYPIVVEEKFSTSEAWAYGCVIVQLHIDHQTGQPRLERIIWVDDAGNIVMPPLAHGQLVGGAAQGIGQALFEKVVYDSQSQLLTGSFMDYAIPRASDIPDIEIISLESASPLNPIGAKGVGEAGCIGIPAAIMNAAKDALSNHGEIDLQFPLTSEQLWLAIHHKETHHEI